MSATKTETVSVDRELLLELIARVDGLATYESLRNGGCDTDYQDKVYRIIEPLERAVFGPISDERSEAYHARGIAYGEEMFRELVREALPDRADDA